MKHPQVQPTRIHQLMVNISSYIRSQYSLFIISLFIIFLTGCPQNNSGLEEENIQLKKQNTKLESVIHSLQEGNKIMQQQIDLLNQEVRKTAESYEQQLQNAETTHQEQLEDVQARMTELVDAPKKDVAKIQILEKKNQKLEGETKWLRSQRAQMRKALTLQQIGGQTQELPFSYSFVLKTIEEALTKNGYSILSTMKTDQKAVFITDRKTSLPSSLELSGFRNQYLLSLEKAPSDHVTLWVRAEFEKLSRNGQMFSAPQSEITDIEMRLIQEIHQALSKESAAQAKVS